MKKESFKESLSNFILHLEELEKVEDKKVKNKRSIKDIISNTRQFVLSKLVQFKDYIVSKLSAFRKGLSEQFKGRKKLTKLEREHAREERNRAILGIGQLLVVVSIAYSTSVIFIGIDSLEAKIALLPQVLFASFTLIRAFSKLYK